MREAIAGDIARRVGQGTAWNKWQKLWWKRLPKIHDQAYRGESACPILPHLINFFTDELSAQCHAEYRSKLKALGTQEKIDIWTDQLADDLAELHDREAQANAAAKVVDIEDELVDIVCPP